MDKKFKTMTYKEFTSYCNERACDGMWSMKEALECIKVFEAINAIKVRKLSFVRKKPTEQAREAAWEKRKTVIQWR